MQTTTQQMPAAARYRAFVTAFLTIAAMLAMPINATAADIAAVADVPPSAVAMSARADAGPVGQMSEAEVATLEAEVARIGTHLSDTNELDYTSAAADTQIRRTTLNEFAVGVVASGGSVVGAGNSSRTIESSASRLVAQAGGDQAMALACEGRNGWAAVPPTIYLSSCNASALSAALAAGAAVATIAALIVSWTGAGAAVAGAIAAALALYSSIYALCNSWGHGIRIYVVTTLPVCWSQ